MVSVGRISRPAGGAPTARAPGGSSGFAVSTGPSAVAGPAAAAPAAGVDGVLQYQAMQAGAAGDREARRHGQALLAELAELQHALLGEEGEETGVLSRLSALLDDCPAATDPALAATLAAVVLRVRIELARRGL